MCDRFCEGEPVSLFIGRSEHSDKMFYSDVFYDRECKQKLYLVAGEVVE